MLFLFAWILILSTSRCFCRKSYKGACTFLFGNILKKSLKGHKTVNKHAIDLIGWYLNKTMSSGNKVSSLNGLIPFKTVYEKRGELLWPFVSLKNLISLRSVAFVTIFVCNLVQACKFHVNLETAGFILFFFFTNWTIPRSVILQSVYMWETSQFQIELNHYEMKLHFQSSFCLDISQVSR